MYIDSHAERITHEVKLVLRAKGQDGASLADAIRAMHEAYTETDDYKKYIGKIQNDKQE